MSEVPTPEWVEEAERRVRRAAPAQVVVSLVWLLVATVGAVALVLPALHLSQDPGPELLPQIFFVVLMVLCNGVPGALFLWAIRARALPQRLRRLRWAWWANALAWLALAGAVLLYFLVDGGEP